MLDFDINVDRLYAAWDELGASERQIQLSLWRAINRTATTLKSMSGRGLKSELGLRTAAVMRKRLMTMKLKSKGLDSVRLWYGINDMPVSWFKGTPKATATGATLNGVNFEGGFVAKSKVKGRKTVFKRRASGRLPLVEQLMPVQNQAAEFVEDHIFDKLEDIFWNHFMRDLKSRVRFNVGKQ